MALRRIAIVVLAVVATGAVWRLAAGSSQPWTRESRYVAVRDGTRLAVDIYRPAHRGEPLPDPLPVVWRHDRYHRAEYVDGEVVVPPHHLRTIENLVRAEYVVALAEVRGAGASFGTRYGPFPREEALDAHDLTEWFAAQPWCDGNVGMFGRSYSAITQYHAAATGSPHLKAIFAEMGMFDMYAFSRAGGVFREDFARHWGDKLVEWDASGAPVDGGEAELEAARAEHRGHQPIFELAQGSHYRDSRDEYGEQQFFTRSPSSYVEEIRRSGVAMYHLGGWFDIYARDPFAWFHALDNPMKVRVGAWNHTEYGSFDFEGERVRWFDHWLKGIDNGIMDGAPILYELSAGAESEWREAYTWPPEGVVSRRLHLSTRPSGTIESAGDGSLVLDPEGDASTHAYRVDPTTTSGRGSRWANGYGTRFGYDDMAPNDRKSLTYTSHRLTRDVEVVGHPIVNLWISCSHEDVDVVCYLEEVNDAGQSRYVTEGVLRASHRAIAPSPPGWEGLPFHRGFEADLAPLEPGPNELRFDLYPTATRFDAGHRIRLSICCADRDNLEFREVTPLPEIQVHCGGPQGSFLSLPVAPPVSSLDD